jgi:hypothetical protein
MKSNVMQLKHAIDSGRTGDKVAFPDPAMAPLGTDEEAGGNPTHPSVIQHTIQNETVQAPSKESPSGFYAMLVAILLLFLCFASAAYFLI